MSFTTRRGSAFYKRPLALIGATALTAGAMVPLAGAANAIEDGVENTCAGLTDDRFVDLVGYTEDVQDAINCLAAYEITQGTGNGTTYEPGRQVLRWEMALFLDRLITYVDENNDDISFADNDDTSTFEDLDSVPQEGKEAIARLADLGIANGFNDEEYGPYNSVLRRQMASFLDRIQGAIAAQSDDAEDFTVTNAEGEAIYLDVPPGHPQYEDIYSVSNAGIAQGTGADLFQPNMATTRSQMALFLTRHLDALVDQGVIEGEAVTPPPEPGEDFTVAPEGAQTVDVGETVTFTFSGLNDAATYQIALFPSASYQDGTFVDENDDNEADNEGLSTEEEAFIDFANGDVEGTDLWDVEPVNGTITVRVQSNAVDQAYVVLYESRTDAADDETLPVDADGRPTVNFAVAGPVTWIPGAAETQDYDGEVVSVDKDANTFVVEFTDDQDTTTQRTFSYDDNDFYIVGAGGLRTQAQFEAELSTGDYVYVSYNEDSEGTSLFSVDWNTPAAPQVEGERGDTGATRDDVTLSITPSDPSDLDVYDGWLIERSANNGATWTEVATATEDADPDTENVFEYVDADLAPGSYDYRVAGIVDGDQGEFGTDGDIVTLAEDAVAPTIEDLRVAPGAGGVLDDGDIVVMDLSENVVSAGESVRLNVTDSEDETFRVTGTVEIFDNTDEDDNETERVAITVTGVEKTGGIGGVGDGELNLPADLTGIVSSDTEGIYDAAGNPVDVAGSDDTVLNDEGDIAGDYGVIPE